MSEVVPNGYITIFDALNRIGQKLFPSDWTGAEHAARRGLVSLEDWLKTKDLPGPSGGGAPGGGPTRSYSNTARATKPDLADDPTDPAYQEEYREHQRYVAARHHLHVELEAGRLEAAVLDPWSGALYRVSTSVWRRHDADRMLARGEVPLPHDPNKGKVFIRDQCAARNAITNVQEADNDDNSNYRTGAPGRPTSRHLIEAEFTSRVGNNSLPSSLRQMCQQLEAWLKKNHPSAPKLTAKSMENFLRDQWNKLKKMPTH